MTKMTVTSLSPVAGMAVETAAREPLSTKETSGMRLHRCPLQEEPSCVALSGQALGEGLKRSWLQVGIHGQTKWRSLTSPGTHGRQEIAFPTHFPRHPQSIT